MYLERIKLIQFNTALCTYHKNHKERKNNAPNRISTEWSIK